MVTSCCHGNVKNRDWGALLEHIIGAHYWSALIIIMIIIIITLYLMRDYIDYLI